MRIIRDYQFIAPEDRGAAVAIGNFDGVHLGHQAVFDLVRKVAGDAPLGILTFEPHPREYFAPDAPAFRLMSANAKAHRLEKLGIQHLYQLNFNAALSALTAEEFARDVIADALGLCHVVVGSDFKFGKNREGSAEDLIRFGAKYGFQVTTSDLLCENGEVFSSTAIRRALSEGRPEDAARMLGHWHRIEGRVIHGDQRGRELGFPTANLSIDGLHPPKYGVYAVTVDILDGPSKGRYFGAASIGERPTFGVYKPNLEVFLFDFSADIYGASISVALVDYQRPELKFDDLGALVETMNADCEQARETLDNMYTTAL
ncbi:riboflavin biosynthesis protein [Amylibacter marinus]|uniref:Riboflavin biosynthesis protein n=1 Tax=Amylibacter marinus TaxID=1475483 RepID=A0ABQ5VXR9_9RHOB|nr:bifunctional riboflavin kinase/FAD synthetase [Amylibacter marinus]GLQ36063.1 riboflavin biosynthesis protein [Amylibacter marinus]